MTQLIIIVAMFALAAWMLWRAVGDDPDEYRRQAEQLRAALHELIHRKRSP